MKVRVSSCTTGSLRQHFCEENSNVSIQKAHTFRPHVARWIIFSHNTATRDIQAESKIQWIRTDIRFSWDPKDQETKSKPELHRRCKRVRRPCERPQTMACGGEPSHGEPVWTPTNHSEPRRGLPWRASVNDPYVNLKIYFYTFWAFHEKYLCSAEGSRVIRTISCSNLSFIYSFFFIFSS